MAVSATAVFAATCCGLIGGINHFTRDFLAALELQVEDGLGTSEAEYHELNVAYFGPNLMLPLFWGFAAQLLGPSTIQLFAAFIAACGNALFLFAVAGQPVRYGGMLAGRLLMGVVYEGLDSFWVAILQPIVPPARFATISSLINAGQRAGSAAAFLLSPQLYSAGGLTFAVSVPSAIGITSVLPAAIALRLARRHCSAAVEDAADMMSTFSSTATVRCQLSSLSPFGFGGRYWVLLVCAALMYSSVVPFWFVGSKMLQEAHGLSVEQADALILIPELAVLCIGPMAAIIADSANLATGRRMGIVAGCQLLLALAYALLLIPGQHHYNAAGDETVHETVQGDETDGESPDGGVAVMPPAIPLMLIGVAWGVSHALFWGVYPLFCPAGRLAVATGYSGVAINIGPTLVPLALSHVRTNAGGVAATQAMFALAVGSAVAFALLLLLPLRRGRAEGADIGAAASGNDGSDGGTKQQRVGTSTVVNPLASPLGSAGRYRGLTEIAPLD